MAVQPATQTLEQETLAEFIGSGLCRPHYRHLRRRNAGESRRVAQRYRQIFGRPRGGDEGDAQARTWCCGRVSASESWLWEKAATGSERAYPNIRVLLDATFEERANAGLFTDEEEMPGNTALERNIVRSDDGSPLRSLRAVVVAVGKVGILRASSSDAPRRACSSLRHAGVARRRRTAKWVVADASTRDPTRAKGWRGRKRRVAAVGIIKSVRNKAPTLVSRY